MSIRKYIPLLTCICLSLSSCDENRFSQVVDVEIPEHEPRIAVSADYDPSSNDFIIGVYESQSILSQEESSFITNASIQLTSNGTDILAETVEDFGLYYGTISTHPAPGEEIELLVSADGLATVSAKQTIPSVPDLGKIEYTVDGTVDLYGEKVDLLAVTIPDNPNEENYYLLSVYRTEYTSFGIYSYKNYLETPDFTVDQINGSLGFTDQAFIDGEVTISSSIYNYTDSSFDSVNLVVELQNVTKDKFLFQKSLNAYYNSQGPFAEPADVHENIENGYGIFTASNVAKDSIRIF